MGNAASALPYTIGKQVALVNHGWTLHDGQRKSDGSRVSVFIAKKPVLQKTPLQSGGHTQHLMQYVPALHHYNTCKKLRHPHILSVTATLDTDNPNDTQSAQAGGGNAGGAAAAAPAASGTTTSATTGNTGDFIIVTEPCIPLSTWLASSQQQQPEQIAWGIECIVQALHFLHTSAGLCHGSIDPSSIYVTPAGDFKVWNFALVSAFTGGTVPRHFIEYEAVITTPIDFRSPERIEKRWDAIGAAGVHVVDTYALGSLISHLFGGSNNLPTPLVKAVSRLQTGNLKMRPKTLLPLLKCPVFDTPYQKLQHQLTEYTIVSVEHKTQFWTNVTPQFAAQIIPTTLALHKLLPLLLSDITNICTNETLKGQESYRRQVLAMLNPLFYIAENVLDTSTVGTQLGKVIGILFKVNDRAIRGTLLQKAPFMAESFDRNTLNEAVFEPMCSGFSDSSAALRELTLKATAALVPHLTHPNLEKLSRYLVRLQSDPETSIRTNTVIFFSKLAPYLTESTRQKMLLPAFERAMKDPFTPCRLAALKSTLKAKEFFDPVGIASRVLPAITPQLLDPARDVRREALMAVDDLLFVLRQESERLNSLPEPVAPMAAPTPGGGGGGNVNTTTMAPPQPMTARATGGAASAATAAVPPAPKSGSSFSLGGISSWMTTGSKTAAAPTPPNNSTTPTPYATPAQTVVNYGSSSLSGSSTHSATNAQPPTSSLHAMNINGKGAAAEEDDFGDDDDGGWDDDDDLDVSAGGVKSNNNNMAPLGSHFSSAAPPSRGPMMTSAPRPATTAPAASGGGALFGASTTTEDDDFFGSFDNKPAKPVVALRTMTGGSGGSKLVIPSKKTTATAKPAVQKLSTSSKDTSTSDGWDDF